MTGGLASILILVPNLFWMLFPPRDPPEGETSSATLAYKLLEVMEWLGRLGVFVIPFFYRLEVTSRVQVVALAVMALALLFYYAGWVRYFAQGRKYALLFQPMLRVPVPMAVSPIVYFAAASVLFGSWYLALATIILGVAHLTISLRQAQTLLART
jgi:hypothetical protein